MGALNFLTSWFENKPPEQYINLRWFWEPKDPGKQAHSRFVKTAAEAAGIAAKTKEFWGAFVGVAPRSRAAGTEEFVSHLMGYWCDIDDNHDDALARVNTFPLKPSHVYHTPGGLHCYWKFYEALEVGDRKTYHKNILEGIAYALKGDPQCKDLSRVLRIPGSVHYKDHNNPQPVTLVAATEACYDPSDFTFLEGQAAPPHEPGKPSDGKVATAIKAFAPGSHQMPTCTIATGLAHWGVPQDVTEALIDKLAAADGANDPDALQRAVREMYHKDMGNIDIQIYGGGNTNSKMPEFQHQELDTTDLIPADSYLSRYAAYARTQTDCPDVFHLFCALAAVAGAVGNKVTFAHFGRWLPPNLWIMLIAPTTLIRKSTAINLSTDILDAATKHTVFKEDPNWRGKKMKETDGEMPVERSAKFPDELSTESLIEYVKDQPGGVLARDEWSAFMSQCDRSYMVGAIELLTKLYDGGKYVKVLRKGESKIEGHAISILGGSTPEWIERRLDPLDFVGGFYPRFIFVPVMERTRSGGIPLSPNKDQLAALAQELTVISKMAPIQLESAHISQPYLDLQEELMAQAKHAPNTEMAMAVVGRLTISTIKIAILLEVAATGVPTITTHNFSSAARITRWAFNEFCAMVGSDIATSGTPFERNCQKALKVLKTVGKGEASRSLICSKLRGLDPRVLDQIQLGLEDRGAITVQAIKTTGRPKIIWKAI